MYMDTMDDITCGAGTGHDELDYFVGGEQFTIEENTDFDGDGYNDAAVIENEDGSLVVADTDGDGLADTSILYDGNGNVIGAAEYDETTGEWTNQDDVNALPAPSGDGADDAYGGEITVDLPGGEDYVGSGYDSDGDGVNDSTVITDEDATNYTFTDTDGDGVADEAVIVEADGDVIIAEHTGDEEWTAVEYGYLDEQGNYVPDSSATSDAEWANC